MIMCGMSAAFTALFGTPMAAAVFSIEVVSVGIMHYSALVPCVISALVAKGTASYFGIEAETFLLEHLPAFSLKNAVLTALLAILGALWQYPQYQLAKHKGYPTKLHYELIAQYGIQPFYRRSFLKKQGYWPESGK